MTIFFSKKEFLLFRELESELDAENRRFGDAQKVSKLTVSHLPVFYLIILQNIVTWK
jgi:hypothetical protein